MSLNDILFRYNPTGASDATAKQDRLQGGVSASQQMAKTDLPRLKKYAADFIEAGQKHGLPPALLAAISSRETRGGARLSASGYSGNGEDFGLMQVNKHSHKLVGGPFSREHINQATGILKKFFVEVKKKHSSWSLEQQLRGAVAAYNFGVSNVRTLSGIDVGTANNDYSSDIWARAQTLAPYFGGDEGRATSVVTSTPATVAVNTSSAPATSSGQRSDPAVHELQRLLIKYGYMTDQQVKTGPGILGPQTRAAIAKFIQDKESETTHPSSNAVATTGSSSPSSSAPITSQSSIDGVPLYRQGDSAWGKRFLGSSNDKTIHAKGCAMTATAMAISKTSGKTINPLELDDYLDQHAGYAGNDIKWDVAAKARGLRADRKKNCLLDTVDKELAANRPVVTGVDYKGSSGVDHWVTLTGRYKNGSSIHYTAHDPATGKKFTFKKEGNKLRAGDDAHEEYVTTGDFCLFLPPQAHA